MAFKNIIKIWEDNKINNGNVDFLTTPTKEVQFPLSKYDKKIIKDLKETSDRIECAGIAANQIGHSKQIFIGFKDNSLKEFKIYINSKIIKKYEHSIVRPYINRIDHANRESPDRHINEGCLSLPNAEFSFPRYHKIKVKYFDEYGNEECEILEKFHAQIFQHELDHLNGKTIAHRLMESIDHNTGGTLIPTGLGNLKNKDINKYIGLLDENFKILTTYFNEQTK